MGVPYVSSRIVALSVEWMQRFQKLSPDAGVIFVSVTPMPEEGGECRVFAVRLGVVGTLEEATGLSLIKHVLAEEIASGKYEIQGAVYRGVSCAGRSASRSATGPYPS
jgi:hypothetical protein